MEKVYGKIELEAFGNKLEHEISPGEINTLDYTDDMGFALHFYGEMDEESRIKFKEKIKEIDTENEFEFKGE